MSWGGYSFKKRMNRKRTSTRLSGTAIPIPLEPLKEGHRMDPQERLFLEAAERGDKHTMIRCLQGPSPVNVNCTNILGRSAIQIAVDNENVEIVELLLQQEGIKIGDALLYAIREGVYRIVEMLINHPSITREMLGSEWSKYKEIGEESPDYSPDVSPVILAAHCNQFEILQLLLSRGARIKHPHHLSCSCSRCKKGMQSDSLRHSLLRIHTYRALASPAWMSLTSSDPVLSAFKLSWELDLLAKRENEFKDLYNELNDQCKKYACDLLDQCRSSEEVIAVLDRSNKDIEDENDEDYEDRDEDSDGEIDDKLTLDRLKLALKYEQKQFVAHPHCQQLLATIWYEGLPGWRKRNVIIKLIIIISLISLMPLVAVYYLILPRSKLGSLIRTPFMKFMYHSASFTVFLILLTLASTNVGANDNQKVRQQQRGPPPTFLEILIVLYVAGFIWAECKQVWEEGFKAYVRQWWNWLDFIMLSLYLCTFSLRFVAYWHSFHEDTYGSSQLPRTQWPEADPTLISEGVFAVANVFSFARIIYLFQANPQLGPLQISLGCMLIDIGKFLFIFFLVLTSFACGMNQLYYYYSNSHSYPSNASSLMANSNLTNATYGTEMPLVIGTDGLEYQNAFYSQDSFDAQDHYSKLDSSFFTLFWAMFGLVALVTLEVKMNIVEGFGKFLFGVYNIAAKILLLNMLIAMMSKSFHTIVDHADREWKFARSKLWMGYFDEGSTLPAPFNLIVSPKSIFYILRWIKRWIQQCLYNSRSHRGHKAMGDGTIKRNSTISVVGYSNSHVYEGGLDLGRSNSSNSSTRERNHKATSSVDPITTERPSYNGDPGGAGNDTPDLDPDGTKYQDVMRRLVSRFIHQWKKQMRQDGVNEDDLLEIKQDISSLRYELREDRKRESARTTSHIDSLKKDIMRTLRTRGFPNDHGSMPTNQGPYLRREGSISPTTVPHSSSGNFLSSGELETLKYEIVTSLRAEIKDLAREMAGEASKNRNSPIQPSLLPPINSELYHTHLYTQL